MIDEEPPDSDELLRRTDYEWLEIAIAYALYAAVWLGGIFLLVRFVKFAWSL
jgi:hypothetical protein